MEATVPMASPNLTADAAASSTAASNSKSPLRILAYFYFHPDLSSPSSNNNRNDVVIQKKLHDEVVTGESAVGATTNAGKMAPPSYSDLGKLARDIFSKGYNSGLWKLDCKTKTQSGIEFNTSGHSNQETGKVFGVFESKYKLSDYGVTLTEKWNTDNMLFAEAAVQDRMLEGLKLAVEGSFAPQTGNKNGKLKVGYGQDYVKFDADTNIDFNGPLINASLVLGYEGFLGGYKTAFDSQKSQLTTNNFALGYLGKDFVLHTSVNDGQDFSGSIYQRVSDQLEGAVQLSWASGGGNTLFGLGAKYQIDGDNIFAAKINNQSQIGLRYQHKLRKGFTLGFSALINGKEINSGGHKFDVSFEFEA